MAKKDEDVVVKKDDAPAEDVVVKIETVAQHPAHTKLNHIVAMLDTWRIAQDADLRVALDELRATLPK